jgi:uncharacterized protein YidB (DUF937 family)
MDILNGMQNGPRGQRQSAPPGAQGQGMSPITMALLGLLAYKAIKGGGLGNMLGGDRAAPQPAPLPGGTMQADGGGLGDMLGGLLGGSRNAGAGGGGLGDMLGGLLGGNRNTGAAGGGLGDILGGLIGGGAAGGVLNGGLGNILRDLQNAGQGRVAQSWVGPGENEAIEPDALANAIGPDTIEALSQQTGLSYQELLDGLSERLPQLVDKLTPEGRLPTEQEAAKW